MCVHVTFVFNSVTVSWNIVKHRYCIGDLMISVLASSVVDHGCRPERLSNQYLLPLRQAHRIKQIEQRPTGIRTMYPSGATCLFTVSVRQQYKNPNKRVGLVYIICNVHPVKFERWYFTHAENTCLTISLRYGPIKLATISPVTLLKCLYQARKVSNHLYRGISFVSVSTTVLPHRWRNGQRAYLDCSRSWVRAPVGSNQRL